MRTETITESKEALITLTLDEASALRATGQRLASSSTYWGSKPDDGEDRTVVSCEPTSSSHWRVTVRNAIGVIRVHGLQIEVLPKIDRDHFWYLAEKSQIVPRMDEQRADLMLGRNLWELMARWYITRLAEVLRSDLIKDYRTHVEALPAASGRIQVMPTARSYYAGRLSLTCEYELFDSDTAPNRVLKAAAIAVLASPLGSAKVRKDARRLLAAMYEVGPLRAGDQFVSLDSRAGHYHDAHLLARQILAAQLREPHHGDDTGWAFLLRTPDLIEEGIRQILAEQLEGVCSVTKQGMQIPGTSLRLQPDLVLDGGQAIADVKYKLHNGSWNRSDLYQVTTFATGFGAKRVAIFCFDQRTAGDRAPDLRIGDVALHTICWPCDPHTTPSEAADTLARRCAEWLHPGAGAMHVGPSSGRNDYAASGSVDPSSGATPIRR